MKVAGIPGGEKTAASVETLSGVKQEEVEMWGMREKAREGNWRKISQVGVGLDGLHHTQLMAAERLLRNETLESEGHLGREGEGERWYSRRGTVAPRGDWLTAGVHGCFPPSGRFPEINPPSSLIPPSFSVPGPRHCRPAVPQGSSWSCASSEKGQGSASALSSAAACPPSRQFCPDTKASLLCSHRSGQSPRPRTLNHRPGPGRSGSSPGSAPLNCCGSTSVDQPV